MSSLLDSVLHALDKQATEYELSTGRGTAPKDKYDERIGFSKGLRKAIDVIKETAKAVNKDVDD